MARKGLFAALEDEVIVGDETPEVDFAQVAEDSNEVYESSAEIENQSETVNSAVDDIGELSDVKDVMEDSIDKGEGLSSNAAELAAVAVEAICARLGIEKKRTIVPSLESFGSKNSRLTATKIAVEGIGETIEKAWQAIKAFFAKMWANIKSFFKKVWSILVNFKNTAKDLITRVYNTTFRADEYTVPGGFTVQQYRDYVKTNGDDTNFVKDMISEQAKIIEKLTKDAVDGNIADAEKLIQETSSKLGIDGVATEKRNKKGAQGIKQEDQEVKEILSHDKETKKLSGDEAKKECNEVAMAVEEQSKGADKVKEVQAAADTLEKSGNHLIDKAMTEVKKLQEIVSKAESPEKVQEAKEKISLWNKIKSFVSKSFSFISSVVSGLFKRVVALIKFGFSWVKTMLTIGVGAVKDTVKGTYNAVVKGEA